MNFYPIVAGRSTKQWILPEVLENIYMRLDPKSLHLFFQTNRFLSNMYQKESFKAHLIDLQFRCTRIDTMPASEQYWRLFLSRMPCAGFGGRSTIPLPRGYVLENDDSSEYRLKINSSSSRALLSGTDNLTLFSMDLKTLRGVEIENDGKRIDYFGLSQEGNSVFLGSLEDGTLQWRNAETGECEKILNSETGEEECEKILNFADKEFPHLVAVKINGTRAISVHSDQAPLQHPTEGGPIAQFLGKVSKLWDLSTGECLHTLKHLTQSFSWLKMITADGTQFLSGSIDLNAKDFTEVLPSKKYEINIWNFTKEGTKDRVRSLAVTVLFSPISSMIASHQWLDIPVKFSANRERALFTSWGCNLKKNFEYWDLSEGRHIQQFEGDNSKALWTKFYSDGTRMLTYDKSCSSLKAWDPEEGKPVATFPLGNGKLSALKISPDGKQAYCLIETKEGSMIRFNVVDLLQPAQSPQNIAGSWKKPIARLKLTPDGLRVIGVLNADNVAIWNCAPLPHERIAHALLQGNEFSTLPPSIRKFVTDVQTSIGLTKYLKEVCVSQMVSMLDESKEGTAEDLSRIKQVVRWIEESPFKNQLQNWILDEYTTRLDHWISTQNFAQISLILNSVKHIAPDLYQELNEALEGLFGWDTTGGKN